MGIVVTFFVILFLLILGAVRAVQPRARMSLACCAMAWSLVMMTAARWAESLNYNIWYSTATHGLIGAAVEGLENGRQQEVLAELKQVHAEMDRTYEKRGNYSDLAKQAGDRLRTAVRAKKD